MTYQFARHATCPLVSIIAPAFFILAVLSEPLLAQRRPSISERQKDLLARETQLREIEKPFKSLPTTDQRILLRQINRDFERIQIVNREMMQAVTSGNALDVKKVLKGADEIRTLAARLKANLLLPEPKDGRTEPEFGQEREEVKAALLHLNKKVRSFVQNPVFQNSSNVVDAQLSAQARGDLETIIELCRNIKKSAAKLERDPGKSL